METIKGKKWIRWHKEKVRKILPVGEKIRAKDLIDKARHQQMNPTKVYQCLKIMMEEGEVRKFKEKPKEAYFVRFEDARVENLIGNFFSELNTTLTEMPDEVRTIRNGVLDFAADFVKCSDPSQREQGKVINAVDKRSVGRIAYSLLLKHVFETIKTIEPELKNTNFYVDAEGSFVPKEWVDKKISLKQRNGWLSKIYTGQQK
jgi:hypothetical protein